MVQQFFIHHTCFSAFLWILPVLEESSAIVCFLLLGLELFACGVPSIHTPGAGTIESRMLLTNESIILFVLYSSLGCLVCS